MLVFIYLIMQLNPLFLHLDYLWSHLTNLKVIIKNINTFNNISSSINLKTNINYHTAHSNVMMPEFTFKSIDFRDLFSIYSDKIQIPIHSVNSHNIQFELLFLHVKALDYKMLIFEIYTLRQCSYQPLCLVVEFAYLASHLVECLVLWVLLWVSLSWIAQVYRALIWLHSFGPVGHLKGSGSDEREGSPPLV